MSKRRKCRRSFFFSCRAVTVVSKTGSAVAWDTSHLQRFGDIKSEGYTHINPVRVEHYATDRPTAGFVPPRENCRQGFCSLSIYLAALSRWMWKNWERRMKRAASMRITPAATTPISDHRCDWGAFWTDLRTIQTRNPVAARGRMPMRTASQALLKIRRR